MFNNLKRSLIEVDIPKRKFFLKTLLFDHFFVFSDRHSNCSLHINKIISLNDFQNYHNLSFSLLDRNNSIFVRKTLSQPDKLKLIFNLFELLFRAFAVKWMIFKVNNIFFIILLLKFVCIMAYIISQFLVCCWTIFLILDF